MSEDDNLQEPLIERLGPSPANVELPEGGLKKRKRGAEDGVKKASKKIPKKTSNSTKKRKDSGDDGLDIGAGINMAFANMDSQLVADYVTQRTRKHESDLSSVELEDRHIPGSSIRDSTSWNQPRTLENLPAFLENFCTNPTKLWSASKKNGTPHTIIVAGAGLRAADLARVIRRFQTKDATVAKLFAKHIKLDDATKFLQSNRTGIAVGTPIRLNDLVGNGALAVDRLERIVIDASHIDQKKRGILEMKETQVPLTKWLNRTEFKERYGAATNGIDLLFY